MTTVDEKLSPEQALHRAQQEMLEDDIQVIPNIAVDAECLVDYGLTNLLIMCGGEKYREIYKQLDGYNESYRADRFETLATSVGINPTRCLDLNAKRHEFDHFVQTKDTVRRIVDEVLDMQTSSVEVTVTVYTGGKYLPPSLQSLFAAMFRNMHVTVKFSTDDLYELDKDEYGKFGEIFVYDFEKLLRSEPFAIAFGEGSLFASKIFAHRIIKNYNDEVPEHELLRNVAEPMSELFEDFEYITMRLVNVGRI